MSVKNKAGWLLLRLAEGSEARDRHLVHVEAKAGDGRLERPLVLLVGPSVKVPPDTSAASQQSAPWHSAPLNPAHESRPPPSSVGCALQATSKLQPGGRVSVACWAGVQLLASKKQSSSSSRT
jgi:hypothetical protein